MINLKEMVVLDLDGTLLNSEDKVSINSKKYLKKLKDLGYIIVIASGRIYESVRYVLEDFDYVNYVITDAGVSCYDTRDDKCIFSNPIMNKTLNNFIKYYDEDCIYMDFCAKNKIYKFSKEIVDLYFIENVKNWENFISNHEDIAHISLNIKTNEKALSLASKLETIFPELSINIMQDSFSDKKWIETTVKGCSKYKAIISLANYLGIDDNKIVAFGDGLNDIDMIKNCKVGVAMNNALPVVKECANYITNYNNNDDGVIEFLREYLNVE